MYLWCICNLVLFYLFDLFVLLRLLVQEIFGLTLSTYWLACFALRLLHIAL
jgi:hypothetical protein